MLFPWEDSFWEWNPKGKPEKPEKPDTPEPIPPIIDEFCCRCHSYHPKGQECLSRR